MKSIVKKSRLLLLSLVWFLVVWFVSIAIWITIINTTPDGSEHKVTLKSLYLTGAVTNEALMGASQGKNNLSINNWLIVGTGNVEWDGQLISVGWWLDNKIRSSSNGWGIWWWQRNEINGQNNSAIGWWLDNKTNWNDSVVVWWRQWQSSNGWVVLWWYAQQQASNLGVVLWGYKNKAMENSLVLWQSAQWNMNSFAWNSVAQPKEARINVESWVLIWTYNPIDGVSLVVSGSMKLSDGDDTVWAIRLNNSWCLTMYDGHTHVLGKKSKSLCGVASWCQFGSVFLQDWDVVTGYSESYSTNCNDKVIPVQCNNWNLSQQVYPYCYKISDKPRRNDW